MVDMFGNDKLALSRFLSNGYMDLGIFGSSQVREGAKCKRDRGKLSIFEVVGGGEGRTATYFQMTFSLVLLGIA